METSDKDIRLAEAIRKIMVQHGLTLSTAESCTSGRIAASLTSVDGASEYVQGGLVAYQDSVKIKMLGVTAEVIEQNDVVSEVVVRQMVAGACRLFGTDFAIASTGYTGAGAHGIGSGTVWIAWGSENDVDTTCLTDNMGREKNTAHAAETALERFAHFLEEKIQ